MNIVARNWWARALRALPLLFLVWSNLHGGVLVGLVVLAIYALFRVRFDRLPLAVFAASALAACVTPALWRTPAYYYGVATSVAARRHVELWAPLSPTRGFDLVLAACAIALGATALRGARDRCERSAHCHSCQAFRPFRRRDQLARAAFAFRH